MPTAVSQASVSTDAATKRDGGWSNATVDVEAEIARLVQRGATRIEDKNEFGYTWTLMADPEGNEFDIGKAH